MIATTSSKSPPVEASECETPARSWSWRAPGSPASARARADPTSNRVGDDERGPACKSGRRRPWRLARSAQTVVRAVPVSAARRDGYGRGSRPERASRRSCKGCVVWHRNDRPIQPARATPPSRAPTAPTYPGRDRSAAVYRHRSTWDVEGAKATERREWRRYSCAGSHRMTDGRYGPSHPMPSPRHRRFAVRPVVGIRVVLTCSCTSPTAAAVLPASTSGTQAESYAWS